MRKVVSSVLVVFMCLFMFTGCHDDRTLEQKISQAEIDRFVNEQKQTPDYLQTCDDLTLEIKGNEVYMGFRLKYSMNNPPLAVSIVNHELSGLCTSAQSPGQSA